MGFTPARIDSITQNVKLHASFVTPVFKADSTNVSLILSFIKEDGTKIQLTEPSEAGSIFLERVKVKEEHKEQIPWLEHNKILDPAHNEPVEGGSLHTVHLEFEANLFLSLVQTESYEKVDATWEELEPRAVAGPKAQKLHVEKMLRAVIGQELPA